MAALDAFTMAASKPTATLSRSSSNRSAYTSNVMLALACPSIRCNAFTLAPADTASDAAVCRRSCGVIEGNDSSAFWHSATAGANTRARQLEARPAFPLVDKEPFRYLGLIHDVERINHVGEAQLDGLLSQAVDIKFAAVIGTAGIEEAALLERSLLVVCAQMLSDSTGKRQRQLVQTDRLGARADLKQRAGQGELVRRDVLPEQNDSLANTNPATECHKRTARLRLHGPF